MKTHRDFKKDNDWQRPKQTSCSKMLAKGRRHGVRHIQLVPRVLEALDVEGHVSQLDTHLVRALVR